MDKTVQRKDKGANTRGATTSATTNTKHKRSTNGWTGIANRTKEHS
jgi:hypothetical protein